MAGCTPAIDGPARFVGMMDPGLGERHERRGGYALAWPLRNRTAGLLLTYYVIAAAAISSLPHSATVTPRPRHKGLRDSSGRAGLALQREWQKCLVAWMPCSSSCDGGSSNLWSHLGAH